MKAKAILTAVVLTTLALSTAVPASAGPIPSSLVPEGARWIVHLDMEKLVGTTLYGYLDKNDAFQIKSRDLDRWLKMDIRRDVKSLTVFGLGPGDNDIVFAVSGKLDKAGIVAMVEADKDHQAVAYGAYTLYSSGSDEYGAFVNDSLLVFSEGREAIEKVLDTAGGKVKNFAGTALSASLKEIPAGAFLAGVLPDLSGLGKEFGQSKVLDQASGLFFMAQEKADTLFVRLQVTAASAESAKNMTDVVQGFIALGRMGGDKGDMARVAGLIDGLKVQQDGKVIRLDFERPSKDIADLISHSRGVSGFLD